MVKNSQIAHTDIVGIAATLTVEGSSKTSTPSVIKLSGGAAGGSEFEEHESPGSGPPPENKLENAKASVSDNGTAETTMSFVLQLGTPERCEEPGQSNMTTLSLRETPTGDPMSFVVQLAPHDNEVDKVCNDIQPVTSIGVAKSTIVYSGNQSRVQIQQNTSRNTSNSSPGVIATVPKSATIVYSANKAGKEALKTGVNSDSSFRAVTQQSTTSTSEQSHHLQQIVSSVTSPISVSSLMTTATQPVTMKSSINNIVNLSQPPKLQMAYEIPQSNKQQSPTIIQGAVPSKVVGTTNMKAITSTMSLPNVQRIHTKTAGTVSVQAANIQKFKTIATVNNQGVTKNFMSRVQAVPKAQVISGTTVQSAPIAQIANNSNVQRVQQNTQKPISIQKSQNQVTTNARVNSNHKTQPIADQTQAPQKNPGLSPKTVTVQKQTQQQKSQQIIGVQNVQRGSATGLQKTPIFGQIQPQTSNNTQHLQNIQQQKSQVILPTQKSHPAVIASNPMKNTPIVSNAKNSNVPNMTKVLTNSLMPVNKAQLSPQTQTNIQHALQAQHIVTQVASQSQQQTLTKQQVVSLPGSRPAANTNVIQPKHNAIQQNSPLTGLPVNTKGSVVVTTKMQSQQASMVLRVGTVKNSPVTGQSNTLKTVGQKSTNPVKSQVNAQVGLPQTLGRTINAQSMKIIQQQQQQQQHQQSPQQNLLPNTQVVHKQPGGIKTIPAQKSTPRNNAQSKATGIKTSLNTNMNSMKNQSSISTTPQKTNVKTILPQQSNAANLLAYKNSAGKTPVQNIQQKLTIMAPQYPSSGIRAQPGVIKTILPVVSPEFQRDTDIKCETDSQMAKEEENCRQPPQSPVRRMPLPYEWLPYCLQFVLQDHNYGAPPPRTPPPASPPPHPKQQPINGASGSTLQHPFMYNPTVNDGNAADDAASAISSETGREAGPEGEETETAAEGEGDDEDSITRCICEFEHDDGYMICCDRCLVWQHVDCMGIDRANIPDEYLCEICRPRRVDRQRARTLQMRKREELLNSDTSSDTSSTSSADTDVGGTNAPSKKRSLQQQQQQQQSSVPRRKSDPPPQSRKLNNNNNNNNNNNSSSNNNNMGKRQRREQHPRQTNAAARRKETMKRGPGKRKPKQRRISLDGEEETQDAWGSNMAPLRQWIEKYEEAVTNHYSPELRARISSIKVNGTHSDLRQSNLSNVASGKCRLNVHSNSIRFLVATMYLPANTPVIELRGKYMLSTQHRSSHPQGRHHVQRPGPFVFFYRLPRDGTEVCVDTRTYGNDARFVRRSCKPNAEVKHCIEKGTLHLYIVTTTAIEKNVEITIRHEQHELLLSPNSNSSLLPLVCACGNPRVCQIATATQPVNNSRRSTNGALAENADGRERRRRGRRSTVCDDSDTISNSAVNTTTITQATTSTTITTTTTTTTATTTPTTSTVTSPATKKITTTTISITTPTITASTSSVTTTPVAATTSASTAVTPRVLQNDEVTVPVSQAAPTFLPGAQIPERQETKKDKKKMTREERKMEAIMKAFERLEKAEQRKQEVQARNAQRKESEGAHSDNDDLPLSHPSKPKQQHIERPMRRKRRKGRARTTSSSNSSRRTRLNSADSDISSGEESIITRSPQSTSQMCIPNHESQFSLRLHSSTKDENGDLMVRETNNQMIPTAAGLLLALANSNIPGPCSPPLQQPTPSKSPTCDSGASSSSQSSTPSTPLSSACLLVAAAVGPLAPGFKFPKTKKVMMNEWLRESPDPSQTHVQIPHVSPNTSMMSSSSPGSANLSGRPSDFISPSDPSPEFLSQSYAAKSLATLVQAANSVSGLCDSPPQRKQTGTITAGCPVSSGSAKKRWLRQAISEECDSPNSRPESPPSEMVAPPKKRRIARESISSDNYTPPTTPTLLISDSGATNTNMCSSENDYIVQSPQSPLSLEEPIKNDYECEQMKDETNSEPEKCDFYDSMKSKIDIDDSILMDTMEKDIPMEKKPVISCLKFLNDTKTEETTKESSEVKYEPMDTDVKDELIEDTVKIEENKYIKHELQPMEPIECSSSMISTVKSQPITAEIVNNVILNDEMKQDDTEMEESKLCKTEMKLEFSGSIADMVNNANESEKSQIDLKIDYNKETRSDDGTSIDEFDVEAQMKKITGDDGNDYKEKVDTNSDKDKSMDGIEGLMDSSKDDSQSDDCDLDNDKVENEQRHFKEFNRQSEERAFKDLERLSNNEEFIKDTVDTNPVKCLESIKSEQIISSVISSEESMFDSVSSNIDCEPVVEPPKIFHSIPPLSERIRKKADPSTAPKKTLDFEAAIIESTIDMESIDISENGDQKTELSTALRELLEAKIDSEPSAFINTELVTDNINPMQISVSMMSDHQEFDGVSQVAMKSALTKVEDVMQKPVNLPPPSVSPPPPLPPPPPPPPPPQTEIRRLKDPRTAIPNEMRITSPKQDNPRPVKRKLSITEYRKRKQQSSNTSLESEPSIDASSSDKSPTRGRSDSASSGTSSLSSDEENAKASNDLPSLTTLPLFAHPETDDRKGGEEGTIGWSAAPTLVERQRENLTERLKREFGLFLSDDEEERARKQGLTAEAIFKARTEAAASPQSVIAGASNLFPPPQLPPQPYIPPPGSASIHYSQYQTKLSLPGQYPSYTVPGQTITPPVYPVVQSAASTSSSIQATPQFLVPQAPPGANPYPPQFDQAIVAPVTTTRFASSTTPSPPVTPSNFTSSIQNQKAYFNHSHSTPRT
ncbi:hypothetical protein PV326_013728 [Microctonus aethiopoides]|nr:hypothetical protein PV326_013728 [Microctonus aethiopoides]